MKKLLARYESWWLDYRLSADKLVVFRVVFFAIVGIDAFLQLSHAPRYGASDFNVANLPLIDVLLPVAQRKGMLIVWMLQAYFAFRIAVGGATRTAAIGLCAAFGYGYFVSQLDSYQHHYLLFLILLLCCFLRWDRTDKVESAWPIRAILMTLSVVYVFAVIPKLEAAWIDGHTLYFQVKKMWLHDLITKLGAIQIDSGKLVDTGGYAVAAALIVFVELFLAIAIYVPRVRVAAAIVGISFHIGIHFSGFKIGLFSFFMAALYLLLLPDKLFALARPAIERVREALAKARKRVTGDWSVTWAVGIGGLAAGSALIALLPFPDMTISVVLISVLGLVAIFERRGDREHGKHRAVVAIGAAHLAACIAIAAVNWQAPTARDFHRYWAASYRNMGDMERAVPIYERAVELDEEFAPGRNALARLYYRTGRHEKAIEEFRHAQRLEPKDWRPYAGEAKAQDALGNGDAALAAAIKALALNPNDDESIQIRDKWANR